MAKRVIEAAGLSKRYRVGGVQRSANTLRDALTGMFARHGQPERNPGPKHDEFWALDQVSFEVEQGETLAFIGHNGAGKSTLLKILSRITEPTSGSARIHGRVGSLLEVGTGFHPELTGRENIRLNGAILGMQRSEVESHFDEIVAFAEIEKFLDTPVKRYSSGMYVRLAFAVAAYLRSDILLVDEVLAVGDARFQKKCLGKMGAVAGEGRTVLFVSHNMTAVQSLCRRAIWLNAGCVQADGISTSVVTQYLTNTYAVQREVTWELPDSAPGNGAVRLRRAAVCPQGPSSDGEAILTSTPLTVEFEYWNYLPDAHLNLSLHVYDEQGVMAFNTAPAPSASRHVEPFQVGLYVSKCHIPPNLLNDGRYRIELMVVQDAAHVLYKHDGILNFEVLDDPAQRGAWHGKRPGVVRPLLEWETQVVHSHSSNLPGEGE